MPEPPSQHRDVPIEKRKKPVLLIIGVTIGVFLTLAFGLALVIHFMLLRTDRFNWLEAPKHSSLTKTPQAG